MTTLQIEVEDALPVAAECDDRHLTVTLADGRVLQTPSLVVSAALGRDGRTEVAS